jgi:hypothetical protein
MGVCVSSNPSVDISDDTKSANVSKLPANDDEGGTVTASSSTAPANKKTFTSVCLVDRPSASHPPAPAIVSSHHGVAMPAIPQETIKKTAGAPATSGGITTGTKEVNNVVAAATGRHSSGGADDAPLPLPEFANDGDGGGDADDYELTFDADVTPLPTLSTHRFPSQTKSPEQYRRELLEATASSSLKGANLSLRSLRSSQVGFDQVYVPVAPLSTTLPGESAPQFTSGNSSAAVLQGSSGSTPFPNATPLCLVPSGPIKHRDGLARVSSRSPSR